jgi:uncharacterized protein YciI
MKAITGFSTWLAEGRRLEAADQWEDAAAAYQKIVDQDAANVQAVARLLIVYRKLKDYKRELAVIDGALAAYEDREKAAQQKWIAAHPKAALAGKAVLKNLGGAGAALGEDSKLAALQKRRQFVAARVGGKKKKAGAKTKKEGATKKAADATSKAAGAAKKRTNTVNKKVSTAKNISNAKKVTATQEKRRASEEKRESARLAKQQAAEKKAMANAAAKKAAAKTKHYPIIFVISLRYLVYPDKLAAAAADHDTYLEKHFKTGEFLASGLQTPPINETILATAKNRQVIDKIIAADPYVKKKWVTVDVIEFSAARVGKGWENGRFGGHRGRLAK